MRRKTRMQGSLRYLAALAILLLVGASVATVDAAPGKSITGLFVSQGNGNADDEETAEPAANSGNANAHANENASQGAANADDGAANANANAGERADNANDGAGNADEDATLANTSAESDDENADDENSDNEGSGQSAQ